MKLTASQLRQIIKEEVKGSLVKRNLNEAMTRITEDEMAAWKSGDWGYVAGDSTAEPGHDHDKFLHGHESGHPMDDEGYMIKSRMASLKKMAEDICEMLDSEDQLPGWVQDLVATSHGDLQHVHNYLSGDVEMQKHQMAPKKMELPMEGSKPENKRLSESHARVTEKEMREWLKGNWGFNSEDEKE